MRVPTQNFRCIVIFSQSEQPPSEREPVSPQQERQSLWLLLQVQQMPGVQKLVNAMASIDDPQDMGRRAAPRAGEEEAAPPGEAQPAT